MTEEEGLERNATWLALKMEQVDHEPRNMGSLLKMEKEKKHKKKCCHGTQSCQRLLSQ